MTGGGSITTGGGRRPLTIGSGNAYSGFSGVISETGNLIKTGTGAQALSGANTYSGLTTISAGMLRLSGGANRLKSGNDIVVTGTLDLNGQDQTFDSVTGGGNILTGGGALTIGSGNSSPTFSGEITETGSVTKSGTGTLTLSGANTYTGGTTISDGVLVAGNNSALGTRAVTLGASAVRLVIKDGLTVTNNITIGPNAGESGRGLIENSSTGNATLSGGTITINNAQSSGGHFANAGGVGGMNGTLTIKDAINSSVPVSHRSGPVIYSGGGSYTSFKVGGPGPAKLGANNGLSTSATVDIGTRGDGVLDLAGYNQTLVGITNSVSTYTATITNSSTSADSTLTTTGTSSYAGTIVDGSSRKVALTVNGGATHARRRKHLQRRDDRQRRHAQSEWLDRWRGGDRQQRGHFGRHGHDWRSGSGAKRRHPFPGRIPRHADD